jgi:hypothetical protein
LHEHDQQSPGTSRRWVFVGGTGRSGTTITAEAISRSGSFTLVHTELRFHVDRGGLLDLASGDTDFPRFRDRLLGPWFQRTAPNRTKRGISDYITRDALEAVLDGPLPHDEGPRRLAGAVWTGVVTEMFGPGRIIEMTPQTMMRADELSRLVDHDAVMVNVVRDGRDVASSITNRRWGPNDLVTCMHWWAHRMREADKSIRLCHCPTLTVPLADLADPGRQEHWASQLAGLVGVDHDAMQAAMSTFKTEAVKQGRWRVRLSPEQQAAVDLIYAELWHELEADAVTGLPPDPALDLVSAEPGVPG